VTDPVAMAAEQREGGAGERATPGRSLEQQAFLDLLRTAESLTYELAEALRPYGLTHTQYNALRILRGAGEQGATCSEVSERMVTRVPDVTRLLDRLEAMGLIARARADADRRIVRTRITAQGLAILAGLDEPVLRLHRRQLGHLGDDGLRALIGALGRVRAHPAE
jgi:DNA-binding MarR family transcriptional regulator